MKTTIRNTLATIILVGFSAASWADFIADTPDNINVGGLDTFLDSTTDLTLGGTLTCPGGNGSNSTAEECWAESVTGTDLTYDDSNTETVAWQYTIDGNIAFELAFAGGTYLIKNGIGGGSSIWVLFTNLESLDWGVISSSYVDTANLGDDFTISHVTEFDGGTTTVSEPGTLGMLGIGLLGLGFARRRKSAI